jgi:hypothetical protein
MIIGVDVSAGNLKFDCLTKTEPSCILRYIPVELYSVKHMINSKNNKLYY